MPDSEQGVREYFDGKPQSLDLFELLRGLIEQQGPCEMSIASQISFGVNRKFAWIWLYNITGANPEGTVQIMLAMNEKSDEPPVYRVTPIGKSRWNHLIVVHSMDEARDPRVLALIGEAYRYGSA